MFQVETTREIAKLRTIAHGTVAAKAMDAGIAGHEPLLTGLDGLLRYAKAHAKRHSSKVAEDAVLGPAWLKAATGFHDMLNGAGAVALERDLPRNSFDGGTLEAVFWHAMDAAGFSESDI